MENRKIALSPELCVLKEPMGHLPSPEDGPQQLEWPVTGLLSRTSVRRGARLLGRVYHPGRGPEVFLKRFRNALKNRGFLPGDP